MVFPAVPLWVLITTFLSLRFRKRKIEHRKIKNNEFFFSYNNTITLLPYYQLIHLSGTRLNFLHIIFYLIRVLFFLVRMDFFSFSSEATVRPFHLVVFVHPNKRERWRRRNYNNNKNVYMCPTRQTTVYHNDKTMLNFRSRSLSFRSE